MRRLSLWAAAFALFACAVASAQAATNRLDRSVVPQAYDLHLRLDPQADGFAGTAHITVDIARPTRTIRLHARDLDLTAIEIAPATGPARLAQARKLDAFGLTELQLTEPIPAGRAVLRLDYAGRYGVQPTGLYRTRREGLAYLATQFQPISARRAFPAFDQPEFKTPFTVTVDAPAAARVVANAPEAAVETRPDGWRRHRFAPTAPLPTYLVALAVGPYDERQGSSAGAAPLRGFAARGRGDDLNWSLGHLSRLGDWLADYFGSPLPYPKLDVIAALDFAGGGMENAGAMVYNEQRLLTGPQHPLDRRRRSVTLHAHELAHQWFGDLVTPAWWDDLWLNEGFATWMQFKAAAAVWPEGEFARGAQQAGLAAMGIDELASARRVREPIAADAAIADAFDSITYLKGAALVAMFEGYLGEDVFQRAVRAHLAAHPHGVATTEDFFGALADASGDPQVVEAFRSFVDQPGVPWVEAKLQCRPGRARLNLSQSRYRPLGAPPPNASRWSIPLCVSVYPPAGPSRRVCTLMSQTSVELDLGQSCPAMVLPNRDGAAYARFDLGPRGWARLIAAADRLPPGEALAAVDSLRAARRAGRVSRELMLDGLMRFARDPAWDVAGAALDGLADHAAGLQTPSQARAFRARLLSLRLAPPAGDTVAAELLRGDVEKFLVLVAHDPTVTAPLAAAGRGALFSGRPLPAERRALAYAAALRTDPGRAVFDALVARARAPGDAERGAAAEALRRLDRPDLAVDLLQLAGSGAFDTTQTGPLLEAPFAEPATRAAAWAWLKANAGVVISGAPEISRGRRLASLGRWFCTPRDRSEFRELVLAHAARIPGYERTLAQTLETIDSCITLSAAPHQKLRRLQ